LLQRDPECLRELRVANHQQILLAAQQSIFGIAQIPRLCRVPNYAE
jgi:hypothetical protein